MMLHRIVVRAATRLLGDAPSVSRIPFGPARGRRLCGSPALSLRMQLGLDEPWSMRTVQRHLRPGDVAYDLGAHIGYTALVMAQAVSPGGAVHAFELHPDTAALLRRTVAANPDLTIHVHPVGVADRAYEVELPIGPTGMAALRYPGSGARCRVVALDQYMAEADLPAPHLVKMDVEGAELEALRGARGLLTVAKPVLLIEFHGRARLEAGLAVLREVGYRRFASPSPLEGTEHFHDSVLCTA